MNVSPIRIPGMIAVALLAAPSLLQAQLRATIDAGGANVRYADSVSLMATTVSPTISYDGGPVSASAMGVLSSLGDATRSMQGAVALSLLSSAFGPARLEVASGAGGTTHQDGTRTGRYLGRARLHAGVAQRGLWIGGSAGQTWDSSMWHTVVEGDVGGWMKHGGISLLGTVTPSAVGDSIRYTDTQAIVRWDGLRTELQAGAGLRSGSALARGSSSTWGSLTATLWLFPQVGLVASGGSYPMDATQGFPGGRYVSGALRIAAQPRSARLTGAQAVLSPSRKGLAAENGLVIAAARDGKRTLRLHAPGAQRVEVMGDFTGWTPVTLTASANGWWSVTLPLQPGTYQVNLRTNGGAWTVPAGSQAVVDEFGTRVGVVHVR